MLCVNVRVCGYKWALKMKVFNLVVPPRNISNISFGFLGDFVQSSMVFYTYGFFILLK